ncbi:hypothetical protein FB45DRAFT_1038835 [Roridomyces roridus]|uniref:Uncharacterized protein n=1 Tax=Roridomyces roridus TaxID=1738132 RepID=A0AAD7B3D3_9AGAR|nr:hypothetical protein FB45DRAFT_1038835 [Roridomyces roridus]
MHPKAPRHGIHGPRWHSTLRRNKPISTLKPELLLPYDYLDIAHVRRTRLFFQNGSIDLSETVHYLSEDRIYTPFPEDARGFFYCAPRHGLPALASSVRFRCTPSPFPSSFATGYDLLLPNGLPWQILVGQAAISYRDLRVFLLHEGFLTQASLLEWQTRLARKTHHGGRHTAALMMFGLQQRFPINFAGALWLHVVPTNTTPRRGAEVRVEHIFDSRVGGERIRPFVGRGHAQFEVSPDDPNILNLRIVKLMGPVSRAYPEEVTGRLLPREGELFYYRPRKDGTARPWSFNLRVQNKTGAAFRMLAGRSP